MKGLLEALGEVGEDSADIHFVDLGFVLMCIALEVGVCVLYLRFEYCFLRH